MPALPDDRTPADERDTMGVQPLAVVTGASRGIGFELAREFGDRGFDLLIVAEDDAIHEAANELRDTGAQVEPVQSDLRHAEGVERVVARVHADGRVPQVIAFNAGVGVGGAFVDNALERELDLLRLNVVSVVHLSKRLVPAMVSAGTGHLLYTASIASEIPAPFMAVYGASKAFVLSFAEALRNELQGSGVSVTAVLPGPTDTDFFRRAGMLDTKVAQGALDDPVTVARDAADALFAGDDKRVAGSIRNRLQETLSHVTPDRLNAAMHRRMVEPGSGNAPNAPDATPRP
jgi:short-subunit dehydrogenase